MLTPAEIERRLELIGMLEDCARNLGGGNLRIDGKVVIQTGPHSKLEVDLSLAREDAGVLCSTIARIERDKLSGEAACFIKEYTKAVSNLENLIKECK